VSFWGEGGTGKMWLGCEGGVAGVLRGARILVGAGDLDGEKVAGETGRRVCGCSLNQLIRAAGWLAGRLADPELGVRSGSRLELAGGVGLRHMGPRIGRGCRSGGLIILAAVVG